MLDFFIKANNIIIVVSNLEKIGKMKMDIRSGYLDIAVAIIQNGEHVLIAQRSQYQSHPGKWEFPGGKVEPSEALEDCLKRELLEELEIKIRVGERFLVFEHNYEPLDKKIHRFFSFWCEILEGKPLLKEHQNLAWVRIEELSNYDFIEADIQLVEILLIKEKKAL
ncbi:MAG: (deoxy)nucleoside triphosphate pyrophosphohydrolase [Candidatus Nealsonbacteria bacterium]|nr:(deoxy)nucleoside triphosphate pyrophosphohydrolase [Candidatus Nealsonbacteria bacterium]